MPPLERLLLHIGLPKTGTKTLQLTMSLNRGLLRRHGFLYPTLKYAASNSTVARKYLNRADGVLFTEEPQDGPERSPSLDVEKAIEIAAELWQWQERRHRRRRHGD